MPNDFRWIKAFKALNIQLEDINPHFSYECIQSYLAYYQFSVEYIDEYRCGFIKIKSKRLFMQFFLKHNPIGTVYLVHGYLDHSGGLSRTVNDLLNNNYQVIVLDLPGHGFSEGEKGTVASFNDYLQAVEKGFHTLKECTEVSDIVGLGHSTGAALLFHAISKGRINVGGLLLVAPLYLPFRWNLFKSFLLLFGRVISQKKRYFKRNSNDVIYRQFIRNDPLQVKVLKAEWLRALEKWHMEFSDCSKIEIPVYILQGTKDRTVEWKQNISFYKNKSCNIQVALFQEARHQLLNERLEIRHQVFRQITSFLNSLYSDARSPKIR